MDRRLVRVNKFKPVSGGRMMGHAEEVVGQLVAVGCDGAADRELLDLSLDVVGPDRVRASQSTRHRSCGPPAL